MSIGVVALFVNFLLLGNIIGGFKKFYEHKSLFALSLIFFASLISLTYSSNVPNGFNFVLNKLPFLVIPLAFSNISKLSKKEFYSILAFFVLTILCTTLVVFFKYLIDFENINQSLKQGKAIWVPFNHIRFSIMLVFAFITSIYLFFKIETITTFKNIKLFKRSLLVFSIFFFLSIHFLSVRSGILVLYLSILIALFIHSLTTKKYLVLVIGLLIILVSPFIAYNSIDSFKNKVNYMKYDWSQYQKNEIGHNSDGRRMQSIKIGLKVAKDNLPLGLGTGGVANEMNTYYEKYAPETLVENRISPHNQFLYTLIDYGIVGLFALLISLFYPFVILKDKKSNIFYILFLLIAIVPLFYDLSLEMQLGITFFALFSSLILKSIHSEQNHV